MARLRSQLRERACAPAANVSVGVDDGASPAGAIVAAQDALVADLDWRGLLVPARATSAPRGGDAVLLWCEDRPLVWHHRDGQPELVVGFPLAGSNAERSPAFLLLLHRFAEEARARRLDFERRNLETGERFSLGGGTRAERVDITADGSRGTSTSAVAAAPLVPGFFEARQAGTTRLVAAAHFADAREADLRRAGSRRPDHVRTSARGSATRREEHPWVPWGVLALALLMACDWRLAETDE